MLMQGLVSHAETVRKELLKDLNWVHEIVGPVLQKYYAVNGNKDR